MRRITYILIFGVLLTSCEDVVDVDLPTEESKLIFEGVLRYNNDIPRENRIRVSTTGSFFGTIEPETLGDAQLLNDTQGGLPGFYVQDPERPGDYIPGSDGMPIDDFLLITGEFNPDDLLVLTFFYLDELYLAFASYVKAPEITSVTQGTEVLFDEDETEIIISFDDPEDEKNYYVISYGNGEFVALEDEFFNGQSYSFSYFSSQDLNTGDEIEINLWGVDEVFYNYYLKLIEQSEMGENTLFQTPVSTVRGNILKVEDIDNIDLFNNVGRPQEFVLGYFAVVQEHTKTLIIQ
ncbi:DUF4249 family protein [Dokdonia sinensis]|uniref:DUF4249 family protein n=1 Tax=Dokdonia sinensis TaxID=2479847 RepID=A0A3M0GS63_9FLAO|nr:DUF4249 family protein [Dokdonia sinensis]RMB64059.1 DUF4249 family protein [Dokdonia sinensis]